MQKQALKPETSGTEEHQKPGVHSPARPARRSARRSRGFTLTEILVTTSITFLILAIGIGGAMVALREYRRTQTRAMLNSLLGAHDEFKAVLKQGNLNHKDNEPFDLTGSSSQRFVAAMKQVPTAETMMVAALNNQGSESFQRLYKNGRLYDRWNTELKYRAFNDGTDAEDDKLPRSASPFFVSAGPDKQFGTDDDISTLDD